ncbi:Mycothiol maleylpyruvate isomerase N-terminal domain-containing protein [Blastococcus aurantiacus]|uniref:Mycothiol maleylpyruvate isomerase N-terminal domain-containing protein n=1 Tax=Blastococcus aurantiacus TaxID=1550231 RepID=A0A1G7JMW6_9ACTN|nr:maleylpyruvate isomerase N-terminal domain-containing protein [Blastococcus aurantiacus]SDF26320.1 Mycothiol maleylpyruvate isomerase N-terminal domain-containing protein [Blastococcus aurantiacus]
MTARLLLLRTAYGDLVELLHEVAAAGEEWSPTACRGWTVLDLGFHLLGDTRRALVGLNTPAPGPADHDAVTYWRGWRPPGPGDDEALRRTRAVASTAIASADLASAYAESTAAVLVTAARVPAGQLVRTQDRVMEVDHVLSTLVVEAAVHHLDLVAHLDRPGPGAGPLAEVRRVLQGLLGGPLPARWDDVTAARRGTGREPLDEADLRQLGAAAEAFPLFG